MRAGYWGREEGIKLLRGASRACILSLLTAPLSGSLHDTRLVELKFHHTD